MLRQSLPDPPAGASHRDARWDIHRAHNASPPHRRISASPARRTQHAARWRLRIDETTMRITIERNDPRDRLPTDRHPRPRSPLLLAQLSSLDDEDSAAPRRLYEGGPAVKASVRS